MAKKERMARDEGERGRDGEDISTDSSGYRRANKTYRRRNEQPMDLEDGFGHLRLAKKDLADGQIKNHGQNMENKGN